MRRWSEVAERVAATTRTSEKTRLLADELRSLAPDELPIAAVFLAGRPFAEVDGRSTGLGWAAIASAVTGLAGAPAGALGEAYDRSSDLGIAVADLLSRSNGTYPARIDPPGLLDVAAAFAAIEAASGPAAKGAILTDLLARCDPLTAKFVVKILSGELRIGLREGLLEAAIATAFERPLEAVKRAGMLTGDIGGHGRPGPRRRAGHGQPAPVPPAQVHARLARPRTPPRSSPGWVRPPGSRTSTTASGPSSIGGERGAPVQPRPARHQRPVPGGRRWRPRPGLGWDPRRRAPGLSRRRGDALRGPPETARPKGSIGGDPGGSPRSSSSPSTCSPWPIRHPARPNRWPRRADWPLSERRHRLEALGLPLVGDAGGSFALSHLVSVDSAAALERAFDDARLRRNEGLMVKDPPSPTRRAGAAWAG